jgi:hypothetical protein
VTRLTPRLVAGIPGQARGHSRELAGIVLWRAVPQGKRSHIAEERYRNTSRVGDIVITAQPVPLVGTAIKACLKTCGRDGRCSRASKRVGGQWVGLGGGIQARHRWHHSRRPGGGVVLLMGRRRGWSTLTAASIDALEELPS